MEQNNERIEKAIRLSKKIIEGILNSGGAESIEELAEYKELEKNLTSEEFYAQMASRAKLHDKQKAAENLVAKLIRTRRRKVVLRWSMLAAAAIIIGVIIIIPNILSDKSLNEDHYIAETSVSPIDKPFVVTSGGKTIQLDEDFQSLPSDRDPDSILTDEIIEEERFNTIVVPAQTTYGIQFEDGTRIKLNGGSSLKYSNKYGLTERNVTLTGEGYFDVAKSATPFIVSCNSVNIKVLGTKFNVNAYRESNLEAVLVEGSVTMYSEVLSEEIVMEPGYLVDVSVETGRWKKEKVDINIYTSWINDRFYFKGSSLTVIIRQIESHFDTSLAYDKSVDTDSIKVSASLNRSMSLDEVLLILERVTNVKFGINESNSGNKEKM